MLKRPLRGSSAALISPCFFSPALALCWLSANMQWFFVSHYCHFHSSRQPDSILVSGFHISLAFNHLRWQYIYSWQLKFTHSSTRWQQEFGLPTSSLSTCLSFSSITWLRLSVFQNKWSLMASDGSNEACHKMLIVILCDSHHKMERVRVSTAAEKGQCGIWLAGNPYGD